MPACSEVQKLSGRSVPVSVRVCLCKYCVVHVEKLEKIGGAAPHRSFEASCRRHASCGTIGVEQKSAKPSRLAQPPRSVVVRYLALVG